MPFTYPQITIGANTYSCYGTLADANAYNSADITATAWLAAPGLQQAQGMVSAVRWLESVVYQGDKSDAANALSFPRTGIPGLDSTTIPLLMAQANFALAALLVDTPDLRTSFKTPLAKALGAGSARVEYFRPNSVQVSTPLPTAIMDLIGVYLNLGTVENVFIKGDDDRSRLRRTEPFGLQHGF